jgi:hypothetical protein
VPTKNAGLSEVASGLPDVASRPVQPSDQEPKQRGEVEERRERAESELEGSQTSPSRLDSQRSRRAGRFGASSRDGQILLCHEARWEVG